MGEMMTVTKSKSERDGRLGKKRELPTKASKPSKSKRHSNLSASEDVVGRNYVEVVGIVASTASSRAGVLSRRIEIPIVGAREIIDLECENRELFPIFRSLKVGQWISLQGALRKRFWRSGAAVASRSYIELHSLKSVANRQASPTKKR